MQQRTVLTQAQQIEAQHLHRQALQRLAQQSAAQQRARAQTQAQPSTQQAAQPNAKQAAASAACDSKASTVPAQQPSVEGLPQDVTHKPGTVPASSAAAARGKPSEASAAAGNTAPVCDAQDAANTQAAAPAPASHAAGKDVSATAELQSPGAVEPGSGSLQGATAARVVRQGAAQPKGASAWSNGRKASKSTAKPKSKSKVDTYSQPDGAAVPSSANGTASGDATAAVQAPASATELKADSPAAKPAPSPCSPKKGKKAPRAVADSTDAPATAQAGTSLPAAVATRLLPKAPPPSGAQRTGSVYMTLCQRQRQAWLPVLVVIWALLLSQGWHTAPIT